MKDQKVVLITGCQGGLGKSLVKYYKSKKWITFGTDIMNISSKYVDEYYSADIESSESINNLIDQITETLNKNPSYKLKCVINNAALQKCIGLDKISLDDFDQVMKINLYSILQISQKCIPLMKNGGNIINIGSIHTVASSENIGAYSVSKNAIVGLSRNMAIDFSKYNIRINCISPGAMNTKMLCHSLERTDKPIKDSLKEMGKNHLSGRIGECDDVTPIIYNLSCNNWITGCHWIIDGGVTAKLSSE